MPRPFPKKPKKEKKPKKDMLPPAPPPPSCQSLCRPEAKCYQITQSVATGMIGNITCLDPAYAARVNAGEFDASCGGPARVVEVSSDKCCDPNTQLDENVPGEYWCGG